MPGAWLLLCSACHDDTVHILFTKSAYAHMLSGHEYFVCEDFEQARKLYENARSMDKGHYNA